MIALIKYHDVIWGSQISVRAGAPADIVYDMLAKDNAIAFSGIEPLKKKFSEGKVTEEDIVNLDLESRQGSIKCLFPCVKDEDKEQLIQMVLTISEKARKKYEFKEQQIQSLIVAITENDYLSINSVHHID